MKNIILFVLWQLMATTSFGQPITHLQPYTREEYLQKSDNQHKAALVLLIAGGAMVVGGSIWGASQINTWDSYASSDDAGAGILVVGGVFSMLGSIPLFIASHRNLKRARTVGAYFKFEKGPSVQGVGTAFHSIPGLSVKFKL